MKSDSKDLQKPVPAKTITLGRVLNQSEEIKESVAKAARELTSVNEVLKQQKTVNLPVEIIEEALAQNEDVESKVTKAADDLHQVNAELAQEVAERLSIEAELADARIELANVRDDLSKSQAKEEETRYIALQDTLTSLPNRLLFEQRLDHGLIQAKRHGWKLAVMFIDIDAFKSINDLYGHDVGDQVLRMVANRLQDSVRGEDTVSRWGGDEFVCLLLGVTSEADVAHLAEKMVERIGETCAFDGTVVSIRVSIGITIYPEDGETADLLFKNADRAMYKAKGTEKRFVLFSECA